MGTSFLLLRSLSVLALVATVAALGRQSVDIVYRDSPARDPSTLYLPNAALYPPDGAPAPELPLVVLLHG